MRGAKHSPEAVPPAFWLQLAERREKSHTRDSIEVYRKHIPKFLDRTDYRAYAEAMTFLRKVRALFAAVKETESF